MSFADLASKKDMSVSGRRIASDPTADAPHGVGALAGTSSTLHVSSGDSALAPEGSSTLLAKPINSGEKAYRSLPKKTRRLMDSFADAAYATYAYHATKGASVEGILHTGLDPEKGGKGTGASASDSELAKRSKGKVYFTRAHASADDYRRHLAGHGAFGPIWSPLTEKSPDKDSEVLQVSLPAWIVASQKRDFDDKTGGNFRAMTTDQLIPPDYVRSLKPRTVPSILDKMPEAPPLEAHTSSSAATSESRSPSWEERVQSSAGDYDRIVKSIVGDYDRTAKSIVGDYDRTAKSIEGDWDRTVKSTEGNWDRIVKSSSPLAEASALASSRSLLLDPKLADLPLDEERFPSLPPEAGSSDASPPSRAESTRYPSARSSPASKETTAAKRTIRVATTGADVWKEHHARAQTSLDALKSNLSPQGQSLFKQYAERPGVDEFTLLHAIKNALNSNPAILFQPEQKPKNRGKRAKQKAEEAEARRSRKNPRRKTPEVDATGLPLHR